MNRDRAARWWYAALTLLVIVAVGWTFVLLFTDPSDPSVPESMLVGNFFSFFTIWSNIMVGIVAATLAVNPNRDGRIWRVLQLDALLCITVTGVVVLVVLRSLQDLSGQNAVTDHLVHDAVPLAAVIGWLLFGPRPRVDRATVLGALVIPLVWIAFTLVRGEIVDWYPYPFVDVIEIGYGRALINVSVIAVLFLLLGAAASAIERWLKPTSRETATLS